MFRSYKSWELFTNMGSASWTKCELTPGYKLPLQISHVVCLPPSSENLHSWMNWIHLQPLWTIWKASYFITRKHANSKLIGFCILLMSNCIFRNNQLLYRKEHEQLSKGALPLPANDRCAYPRNTRLAPLWPVCASIWLQTQVSICTPRII